MGKTAWRELRGNKFFYVQLYRKALFFLLISLLINIVFALGVYYFYFMRPAPDFYASNGILQPVKLDARLVPNAKNEPLLPSAPKPDNPALVAIQ